MIYHNVFRGWSTFDKMALRSKCYKGDPPNPNDPSQISPVEFAQTRRAVMDYNAYVKSKPMTNAYTDDIMRDPSIAARGLQGTAGADLAQKAAKESNFNPNMGMPSFSKGALLKTKVAGDLGRDAVSQRAAAAAGILQSKLGLQSNVNTAQEGMARDAVERNTNDIMAENNKKGNTMSALSSVLGAGSSAYFNRDKKA